VKEEAVKEGALPGRGRAPFVTLAALGLSLAAFAAPEAFELTREGLLRGEFWRLLTGHLAHYSLYHLAVDGATLLALGWLYEESFGPLRWALILLGAAAVVSGAFLVLEPRLSAYRGLSGLDCAAFAAAILAEGRRRPWLAAGLALVFAAKLVYEQLAGGFIFPATGLGDMGCPVLSAHTAGAAAGFLGGWRPGPRRREPIGTAAG
jgi:rhomboid family GlyGly-CTERM serine protease